MAGIRETIRIGQLPTDLVAQRPGVLMRVIGAIFAATVSLTPTSARADESTRSAIRRPLVPRAYGYRRLDC